MGVIQQPFKTLLKRFHGRKQPAGASARVHGSDNDTASVSTNSDASSLDETAW